MPLVLGSIISSQESPSHRYNLLLALVSIHRSPANRALVELSAGAPSWAKVWALVSTVAERFVTVVDRAELAVVTVAMLVLAVAIEVV